MGAIVIKPQDSAELELISKMLLKMNIKSMFISDTEVEKLGLVNAIDAGRKTKLVDISEAKKILQ
ncbi:MAG TPA: hypothetical protein DHV48_19775 [Prolixibacteraceae bacterium]|nr:hypothetical protein [Prolixibacteraceae bacterium]